MLSSYSKICDHSSLIKWVIPVHARHLHFSVVFVYVFPLPVSTVCLKHVENITNSTNLRKDCVQFSYSILVSLSLKISIVACMPCSNKLNNNVLNPVVFFLFFN